MDQLLLRDLGELRRRIAPHVTYYIPTRYPNGLPGGISSEAFTSKQATEAISFARQFIARARG